MTGATAVLARVPHFDTFDGNLIKRSGTTGDSLLVIARPAMPEQLTLHDAEHDAGE